MGNSGFDEFFFSFLFFLLIRVAGNPAEAGAR
jgi:hypothetical protein